MTTIETKIVVYTTMILALCLLFNLATFLANRIRVKQGRNPVPYQIPWLQLGIATLGFWGSHFLFHG